MQKLSIRKLSLLSLVLLAASAVTAAVMPKDKSDKDENFAAGNTLRASTGGGCGNQLTCTATGNLLDNSCNRTVSESTTNGEVNPTDGTSTVGGGGVQKTTADADGNDNSTSDLGIQTTRGNC